MCDLDSHQIKIILYIEITKNILIRALWVPIAIRKELFFLQTSTSYQKGKKIFFLLITLFVSQRLIAVNY